MLGFLEWSKYKEDKEYKYYRKRKRGSQKYSVIGITRVRNEELILPDTFDHVSKYVDAIVALDDHSTDRTLSIIKNNKNVIKMIVHKEWKKNRTSEETAHRQLLYHAVKEYNPDWIFYFDADERFEISKRELLSIPEKIDGIKVRLFDAYMTPDDQKDFIKGDCLYNFRKNFGPEYRDILMFFRNRDYIQFIGDDSREPKGCKCVITDFYCQHYGKAISYVQWEETCNYYANHFPEPYKTKWTQRKGKAIHDLSDFGKPLLSWDDAKLRGIQLK